MALLIIPPVFNPLDLILELPSKAAVETDKLQFLQYITPAAQAERAEQRSARQQAILSEQSGIVNALQAQCLLDHVRIDSNPDVIFITPFRNVDCGSASGVLTAVPASGEIFNGLSQEFETLKTDAPFVPSSTPSEQEVDNALIGKYEKILQTWTQHVQLATNIVVPPADILFGFLIFTPAFLLPNLIHSTCAEMYFSKIKPYNQQHKAYIKEQKDIFDNYDTPEARQARLNQRLAAIPGLRSQLAEVNTAITNDQAALVLIDNGGDIITVGGGRTKEQIISDIANLNALKSDLQNRIDHPEIDTPFVFNDPFDEVTNGVHAMVSAYMGHLLRYLTTFYVSITALPPTLSVLSFSPSALIESRIVETTNKIVADIKGSGGGDITTAIQNFVLNGLIKRLDQHLLTYGQLIGTVTYFFPVPVVVPSILPIF